MRRSEFSPVAFYTESGGQGDPTFDTAQAIAVMLEKHGIACDLMHQPAPLPESSFYVYAILCDDDSVYIGQTDDLMKRWGEHRRGTGADWTKKHPPIRIAHYEVAATRDEAVTMEKEWKTGFGRKRIKRLIENGTARQAGGFNWDKWTGEMSNDEFGMSNGRNFGLRTSAFALPASPPDRSTSSNRTTARSAGGRW